MKKIINCLALCATILNFTACKKGDTGPQGIQGTPGTNGVANISTSVQSSTSNSWQMFANDNSYNVTLNVPAITQAVVNGGTIQVFLGNGTGNYWTGLPSAYHGNEYNFDYEPGKVYIYVTNSDGTSPANPGSQQFKVVVFPPASKSATPDADNHASSETVFYIQ